MKNIALIPMRGGSKAIPKKNIKLIAGKPLCYWAINSALQSHQLDCVFISTDSYEIAHTVEGLFPNEINKKLKIEMRDPKLAQDTTSTEDVIFDFIKDKEFENFALIQVTSPLLTSDDINNAFDQISKGCDSALSVVKIKRFFWNKDGTPQNYDPQKRPRRQDFDGSLVENGAIYTSSKKALISSQCRISGKIGLVEMPEESFLEIDEPIDLKIIDTIMTLRLSASYDLKKIKAFVFDVDGTLTDGGMYYNNEGEYLKKYDTKDFKGLSLLKENNYKVCIITAENSERVHSRLKKVGFPESDYFYGVTDKLSVLEGWAKENSLELSEIAYAGDDLGDKEVMLHCGFTFCPADAIDEIKSISNYICKKQGGHGAIREFIDYFLKL